MRELTLDEMSLVSGAGFLSNFQIDFKDLGNMSFNIGVTINNNKIFDLTTSKPTISGSHCCSKPPTTEPTSSVTNMTSGILDSVFNMLNNMFK